jgi:hypothetical protein
MSAVCVFAACSSEPEYADPEAHEKMTKLREQYAPLLVGTWHFERVTETQRFFEQLTFEEDGTLTGTRKWQSRQLVSIDDEQRYTDWEEETWSEGAFTGKWALLWDRDASGVGSNQLDLFGDFLDNDSPKYHAYSHRQAFSFADATTLCFRGVWFHDADGMVRYQRGTAEPSF